MILHTGQQKRHRCKEQREIYRGTAESFSTPTSQLSSAANNPYAKVADLGVGWSHHLYSYILFEKVTHVFDFLKYRIKESRLKKKQAQPKSWELFYLADIHGTSSPSPGRSISDKCWENCWKEEKKPGYIETLRQPLGSQNKMLLLFKENEISQVKEFSAFLCMGRCKSLGSLKSFLW